MLHELPLSSETDHAWLEKSEIKLGVAIWDRCQVKVELRHRIAKVRLAAVLDTRVEIVAFLVFVVRVLGRVPSLDNLSLLSN